MSMLAGIQNFLSPRPVPKIKNPVYPTIYSYLREEREAEIHAFLKCIREMKYKLLYLGFELSSSNLAKLNLRQHAQ